MGVTDRLTLKIIKVIRINLKPFCSSIILKMWAGPLNGGVESQDLIDKVTALDRVKCIQSIFA